MLELVIFVNKSDSGAGWLYSQQRDRSILQSLEACETVDKLIVVDANSPYKVDAVLYVDKHGNK